MSDPTPDVRWAGWLRTAGALWARKLAGGLLNAACARTWMPGICPGAPATGSLLSEKRREHD
jgi:hypothetical protein